MMTARQMRLPLATIKNAKVDLTFAAVNFPRGHFAFSSAAGEVTGKISFSSINRVRMSWHEMQRWLDAEAKVILEHQQARIHSRPA